MRTGWWLRHAPSQGPMVLGSEKAAGTPPTKSRSNCRYSGTVAAMAASAAAASPVPIPLHRLLFCRISSTTCAARCTHFTCSCARSARCMRGRGGACGPHGNEGGAQGLSAEHAFMWCRVRGPHHNAAASADNTPLANCPPTGATCTTRHARRPANLVMRQGARPSGPEHGAQQVHGSGHERPRRPPAGDLLAAAAGRGAQQLRVAAQVLPEGESEGGGLTSRGTGRLSCLNRCSTWPAPNILADSKTCPPPACPPRAQSHLTSLGHAQCMQAMLHIMQVRNMAPDSRRRQHPPTFRASSDIRRARSGRRALPPPLRPLAAPEPGVAIASAGGRLGLDVGVAANATPPLSAATPPASPTGESSIGHPADASTAIASCCWPAADGGGPRCGVPCCCGGMPGTAEQP
jgi:hypothetical protein